MSTNQAVMPSAIVGAEKPFFRRTHVFRGNQGGYRGYRIPALVRTAKGTLVLSPDARNSRTDWGWIDLVLSRSTDGGQTWSAQQTISRWDGPPPVNANGDHLRKFGDKNDGKRSSLTFNNQTLIPDADGRVHLIYFVEYHRAMYRVSTDDASTWSDPVEITASAFEPFRKDYPWRAIITGPGAGIQLSRGAHKGRLIAPASLICGDGTGKAPGDDHRPSVVATIYSDDGGKTWLPGQISAWNNRPLVNPGESILVELSDGSVMQNIRSESPEHRRAFTVSPDGISKWSPVRWCQDIWEPVCHAGLTSMAGAPGQEHILLFSNPDSEHRLHPKQDWCKSFDFRARENLSVRASFDDGKTWPLKRVIEPGASGYSALVTTPDGTIYCAFEHGLDVLDPDGVGICVVAFNLAWIQSGQ
jgi:sialidase-1